MSNFTFKEPCTSCGSVPSYNGHGLCEVCVTGDKSKRNDWLEIIKDGGYVETSNEPLYLRQDNKKGAGDRHPCIEDGSIYPLLLRLIELEEKRHE